MPTQTDRGYGRTFNVSGFSPQTLNKTDCLTGNSY